MYAKKKRKDTLCSDKWRGGEEGANELEIHIEIYVHCTPKHWTAPHAINKNFKRLSQQELARAGRKEAFGDGGGGGGIGNVRRVHTVLILSPPNQRCKI